MCGLSKASENRRTANRKVVIIAHNSYSLIASQLAINLRVSELAAHYYKSSIKFFSKASCLLKALITLTPVSVSFSRVRNNEPFAESRRLS
jgi:hypothetical protein